MFLLIFSISFLILIILDYMSKKRRFDNTINVPGPRVFPFIGNLMFLTQKNCHDVMNNIILCTQTYGSILRAWGANRMYVVTIDPKDLEVIQSSSKFITKSLLYKALVPWLGDGLLISSGIKWHQRRKILTQAYHFKILEQFIEVFDQQTEVLVNVLRRHANETAFDIQPLITAAALDVIAETAMSTRLNAQLDPNSDYVRAVADITEVVMNRMANVLFQYDIVFKLFAPGMARRQEKARKVLHNFTENIIKERRESLILQNEEMKNSQNDENFKLKNRMTFLDLLLQATINGEPLSDTDIREEVDTFMFEGHDTTTSGISFCLYCISRHKEIQDKLVDEIRQVQRKSDAEPISFTTLQELKYMELVIKESLRMYPSVPIIGRLTLEDTVINGRTIPADTNIIIPIFAVHRNPDLFPEPDIFRPERHIIEKNNATRMNSFAYIPFSAGPRNCIGQKFALLEMKCVLLKILTHYELLPMGNDPQVEMNVILRSMNGVQLGMRPRIN